MAALGFAWVLAAAAAAPAAAGDWTLNLVPLQMEISGHDPHVLTLHRLDVAGAVDDKRAVALETDGGPAYRVEFQYHREAWSWGVDFFWFNTQQKVADLAVAAAGPGAPVEFEVADRTFTSTGPGETLFYRVLEDTDVAAWTVDFYALRTLAETDRSAVRLQLGVRNADFDNDYRAIVGVEGSRGLRFDASSNYGRLVGPVVGLLGEVRAGRHRFEGYLGQSLIMGDAELTSFRREFVGPFSDTDLTVVGTEVLRRDEEVAIPISEARLRWSFDVTRWLALGLGADTAVWWDVPVPPGVAPIPGGDELLNENTLVFFGLAATAKLTF